MRLASRVWITFYVFVVPFIFVLIWAFAELDTSGIFLLTLVYGGAIVLHLAFELLMILVGVTLWYVRRPWWNWLRGFD